MGILYLCILFAVIYGISTVFGLMIIAPLRSLQPLRQLDETGIQFKKTPRQYTVCDFFALAITQCILLAVFRHLEWVALFHCILITLLWLKLIGVMQPVKSMTFYPRLLLEVVILIVVFFGPLIFFITLLYWIEAQSAFPFAIMLTASYIFFVLHETCKSIVKREKATRDTVDAPHIQAVASLNSSFSS